MTETLDTLEQRVLGVLIEKSLATPDHYPLSLNALVAGCNQKSNRDPVMLVSEPEARLTIDGLRMKHLAGISNPAGARVERYTHSAAEALGLPKPCLAVLAELLLRGPQARGELRGRANRMASIPTLEDLAGVLDRLREKGFVTEHPPAPGSRAPRIAHTMGAASASDAVSDDVEVPRPEGAAPGASLQPAATPPTRAAAPSGGPIDERVRALESEVATLRRQLAGLAETLGETLD